MATQKIKYIAMTLQEMGALTRIVALGNMHPDASKTDVLAAGWVAERVMKVLLDLDAPKRPYSNLYELRLGGKPIGRTTDLAKACILARHLAAGGYGTAEVEGIPDAEGNRPFGFSYFVNEVSSEAAAWKAKGYYHPITPEEAGVKLAAVDEAA